MATKKRKIVRKRPSRTLKSNDSSVANVVEHLRQGIVSGKYKRDSKILPRQIADRCGTSFIPVREALRIMESEGFIIFRHNRGAWVTTVSLADLEDLYDLRVTLETQVVAKTSPFSDDELEKLKTMIQKMSIAYAKNDNGLVVKLNREFHFSIYSHGNSERRLRMIRQLWMHAERYQQLSLQVRHNAADEEHLAIVNALAARNHDLAAEALKIHLATTVSLLKAGWQKVESNTFSEG